MLHRETTTSEPRVSLNSISSFHRCFHKLHRPTVPIKIREFCHSSARRRTVLIGLWECYLSVCLTHGIMPKRLYTFSDLFTAATILYLGVSNAGTKLRG